MEKQILRKECRFVVHVPAIEGYREDFHYIKELIVYDDGTTEPNIKKIKNFQRPFWITKPHYQIHKDKKETEDVEKLNKFYSTQSDLPKAIAARLGNRYVGVKSMRDVAGSPYLYGTDVATPAIIKDIYIKKYGEDFTPYSLCVLDIETNVDTDELLLVTVCMKDKCFTAINSSMLKGRLEIEKQLNYLYKTHIPKTHISESITPEYLVCDNEIDLIKAAMSKAHSWSPDFMLVWNIKYDIPFMLKVCEKYNVRPEDIFCDPTLPKNYRFFRWIEGAINKVTASGKHKPLNPEEQWHTVKCTANHYWMDAMSAYWFVRVGGKKVPTGYNLNSILEFELKSNFKKLKFEDDPEIENKTDLDWHKFMVAERPLEYVIYNIWDCMSILHLDEKTKDYSFSVPTLSGVSDFSIFNSGPKRIVDALQFFSLERGKVLGVKPPRAEEVEHLGLDFWIAILNNYYVNPKMGWKGIKDNPSVYTNMRRFVFDSDEKIEFIVHNIHDK
ncbi:3'-5' exonuclease [Campylobacter coli]